MVQMTGKFQQQKSENLDEYFKAVGMPFMARKMVGMTSPLVEIDECDGTWTIKTTTMLRTNEIKFKENHEFEEPMPGGILRGTASVETDKITIKQSHDTGTKVIRNYEYSDQEFDLIIVMIHEASGTTAKRFFKRV